ncbi:MAG: PLDc N-terminal domain-containing protein [Bacteroidota bacterium]
MIFWKISSGKQEKVLWIILIIIIPILGAIIYFLAGPQHRR